MLVKPVHPANAPYSIFVKLFGKFTFFRFMQSEKASPPIVVTPSDIVTVFKLFQTKYRD